VKVTGSVGAALFLSQMLYWAPRGKDPDGWIYKTVKEWTGETGLSRDEQQTARKRLVRLSVMEEQRRGIPYRLYYRIDLKKLADLIAAPAIRRESRQLVSRNPVGHWTGKPSVITETTPETTPETTTSLRSSGRKNRSLERMAGSKGILKTPKKPTPDPLQESFDRLWSVIPKRISAGEGTKTEAWEAWAALWKSLKSPPTSRYVDKMVRLLKTYLEEETDYAFYEYDGSVKVTPARLIELLCQALQQDCPLTEVVCEEVPV